MSAYATIGQNCSVEACQGRDRFVDELKLALKMYGCRVNEKGGFGHSKGIEYMKAGVDSGGSASKGRVGRLFLDDHGVEVHSLSSLGLNLLDNRAQVWDILGYV